MADKHTKQPKKKHTLADRMKVYKKRFLRLDKKTQLQAGAIAVLAALILVAAMVALFGKGKNPASSSQPGIGNSLVFSGSYDPLADSKYEDEYTKLIREYTDVVIPENTSIDRNYFRETIFVGDSNTEALATYGHLSLQYVMGVTGMPINTFTTNKCIWFVGQTEPVTMPQAISMMKPRRIIMNFGTNNAGGTTTEDFVKMYKNAIAAVKKSYPYTDIIVASVFPIGQKRDYPNITMQDIDSFNIALAEMCRELGYKFLNTAEQFKNPENGFIKNEYISSDGIHLNSDGYKAFIDYVNTHQHVVEDTRPARGNIPTRRNPPVVTPSPSPTPERTATPTPTASPSPSPSISPSPSAAPTVTPALTPEPTPTVTPTSTPQVTTAPTAAPTLTPQVTTAPTSTPQVTTAPTAAPTAAPTEAPKETCPDCGSADHTTHPTCPDCGSKDHTSHPTCPDCGSKDHTTHPTCPDCGSKDHTTHPEEEKPKDDTEESSSEE